MPSIRQFEMLRAIAERRHFGRAAEALGVTQPALTRSLQKLEERLGAALFDRQSMRPTVFGEAALRFAAPTVDGFEELHREIALLQGVEIGELVVAMGPYPADISGKRAIAALLTKRPRLTVKLRVCNWSEAISDVLRGAADVAIAEISEIEQHAELDTQLIRKAQGYFFCRAGHPLAKRKRLTLHDLLEFPWVGPSYPARIRSALPMVDMPFGVFEPRHDRFSPRILVETFSMAKELVLASDAISAFVPGQIIEELKAQRCVRLPVRVPNLSVNYGSILKRGRARSPATEAFLSVVREIEAGIPAETP